MKAHYFYALTIGHTYLRFKDASPQAYEHEQDRIFFRIFVHVDKILGKISWTCRT